MSSSETSGQVKKTNIHKRLLKALQKVSKIEAFEGVKIQEGF